MVTSGLHTKAQTRGQPREGGRSPRMCILSAARSAGEPGGGAPMAPEGSRMLSAVEEDATCTHREGGLCRARSAGYGVLTARSTGRRAAA